MKAILIKALIVLTGISLFSQIHEEIVNNTILNLNISKFDKTVVHEYKRDPKKYTLKDEVKVEISEVEAPSLTIPDVIVVNKTLDDSLVIIERIVNIASKFWEMVVSNKPALNLDIKYACALPFGVSGPAELQGWSKPKSYLLSFYFENLYGIDVIRVSYQVTYVYGGNYNGKGKYLAAVWAIPVNVDVMWGFNFNMQAYVPDQTIVNVGTSKNPIAALQLKVSWSASSILRQIDGTSVYYIQGDGYFKEIASPFKRQSVDLSKITEELLK